MKTNYYYILKRGYYYRPESKGYTDKITEAGIFTYEEMRSHLDHCDELTSKKV